MSLIYVMILNYIKPLEDVDAEMDNHIKWLEKGYEEGVFIASGKQVPRVGGIILAKSDSLEKLQERNQEDPFQKAGLVEVKIIAFDASMKLDGLNDIF